MVKTGKTRRRNRTRAQAIETLSRSAGPGDEKQALNWLDQVRALVQQGKAPQAEQQLRDDVIRRHLENIRDPKLRFLARYDISSMLFTIGRYAPALSYCFAALQIEPSKDAYNLLGLIYRGMNQITKAIEALSKARELDPDNHYIWNNLGLCLMKVARGTEAVDLFRRAARKDPTYREAHSNLLLHLNYIHDIEPAEIFEESKRWAHHHAISEVPAPCHDNTPEPDRKLRIGYISPDFKEHSVAYFFESLLMAHNRESFEIYGYSNVQKPDAVTESFKQRFDVYHTITGADHKTVANLIGSEKIDILVEMAGHTKDNSLGVLAHKPAPIQVTYCGYPNTTGMEQIDYRLTDAIADTPDQQACYTEELVYLPNGFLCFTPGAVQPTITAAPYFTNRYITFGSFNNISKVNPPLMKLWVKILNGVPGSKLLMKFGEAKVEEVRTCCLEQFEALGLVNAAERILLVGYLPSPKHLELYNAVDIALDTFPYNGTTTTFQSLLMGVPVITRAGRRHASRVGLDILSRLDMQFFAAETDDDYVKKAVALAMKPEALNPIRATMRQRLAASPWCNPQIITHDIEQAYRTMWHRWCERQTANR